MYIAAPQVSLPRLCVTQAGSLCAPKWSGAPTPVAQPANSFSSQCLAIFAKMASWLHSRPEHSNAHWATCASGVEMGRPARSSRARNAPTAAQCSNGVGCMGKSDSMSASAGICPLRRLPVVAAWLAARTPAALSGGSLGRRVSSKVSLPFSAHHGPQTLARAAAGSEELR